MGMVDTDNYPRWCTRFTTSALTCALLCGCAGGRLYSEVRDKQGIAAKAAWEQVDLNKMVGEDRENLKKVLQAQLDTQEKASNARRNFTLSGMLGQATVGEGIQKKIDDELRGVAGPNAAASMPAWRKLDASRFAAQRKREAAARSFTLSGLDVPDCASIKAANSAPQAVADFINSSQGLAQARVVGAVEALRSACQVEEETKYVGAGGRLQLAIQQEAKDREELEQMKARSAPLRAEYQAAKLAYEQAVKDASIPAPPAKPASAAAGAAPSSPATSSPTSTASTFTCVEPPAGTGASVQKIGHEAERLCRAMLALEAADDAFSTQLLSKERLDSLEKFVTAVTQSTGDGKVPEGAGKAATAFILLPKLVDDARASLVAAKMPLAMPLLIRRNIEQLKLEGATKEIALLETRVQLSAAITDALYLEAVQLWQASSKLGATGMIGVLSVPVAKAFFSATEDQKEQLFYATAQYLDAINRLEAKWRKLEYQRIATFHEISLSYAEVNLKQWSSLIGSAVDQVAESAGDGIKPENVTALINSLGILWIGRGVNK